MTMIACSYFTSGINLWNPKLWLTKRCWSSKHFLWRLLIFILHKKREGNIKETILILKSTKLRTPRSSGLCTSCRMCFRTSCASFSPCFLDSRPSCITCSRISCALVPYMPLRPCALRRYLNRTYFILYLSQLLCSCHPMPHYFFPFSWAFLGNLLHLKRR